MPSWLSYSLGVFFGSKEPKNSLRLQPSKASKENPSAKA